MNYDRSINLQIYVNETLYYLSSHVIDIAYSFGTVSKWNIVVRIFGFISSRNLTKTVLAKILKFNAFYWCINKNW